MDMQDLDRTLESGEVKIPDLDWNSLLPKDKVNIPTENPVEIIPQLQEAWSHERKSMELIPNQIEVAKEASSDFGPEAVQDVVNTAKKEMMKGAVGRELAGKLSSMYPEALIKKAKEELVKVAMEQGLLGNVYVDLSAFDSCSDALKCLGMNKVRMAKYAVGKPRRHVCSSHNTGYCRDLKKRVVAEITYDTPLFSEYTDHLRIAGVIGVEDKIDSKDSLRIAFIRRNEKKASVEEKKTDVKPINPEEIRTAFVKELEKSVESRQAYERRDRFNSARPILAFMQNEMLKGRIGGEIKEALVKKFASNEIKEYAPEIRKIAKLQGLMGNVYVDVSYYKTAEEAISSIKSAKTSPTYIVQTVKNGEFDDTLVKVAKGTGCAELPKDGKIEPKIAQSYIDDLHFNNRISSDTVINLRKKIDAGENILKVIQDAFLSTESHKRPERVTGVQANFLPGVAKKSTDRDNLRSAAHKALGAGVPLEQIENKLASFVPTSEAVGMVRSVLASMKEVNPDALTRCTVERYQLSHDATLKKTVKCAGCVLNGSGACLKLGARFAGEKDPDEISLSLDPKTAKVQYAENPDDSRVDMQQAYDMTDNFGSGMNIALDDLRDKKAMDINVDFSSDGVDMDLSKL